jgi:protein DGCR14
MSERSRPSSGHSGGQRRQVLSEEEYTATLSSIVQRDYFPDLPNLERQSALLERRAQGDMAGAVAVRRATRRLADNEEALAALEADDEHDLDETTNVRKRARPLHQEGLTGFHSRVTNEDNEEFDSNQKTELVENRERLEKLFRPQEDSLPLLTNMASDQFDAESNRISASEWNKPKVRSALFFPPTPLIHNANHEAGADPTTLFAHRSARDNDQPSSNPQVAFTTMPPPANKPNNTNSLSLSKTGAAIPKHALVEYVPKHVLEKKIEPSQTRFPDKIVPLSNRSLVHAAAEGDDDSETDESVTDASTDLDETPLRSIQQERQSRQRKLDRDQKTYVAMTPLLVPGAGSQSPITTWGTIDSTPVVLSGQQCNNTEEESTSAFSLSTENDRDRAARKAEKELARRSKRVKTVKVARGSLTPAAQSFLEKTKRTPSRPRDAFASALRSSYTPKPSRPSTISSIRPRSSSSSRRQSDSAHNATPLISRKQK